MTLKTEKPNVDAFIKGATKNEPIDHAPSSNPKKKEKTFMMRLPYDLWMKAKLKATEQDIPLHDFLLNLIVKGIND
jgi:predicted HicB family RNase H-like nuclease